YFFVQGMLELKERLRAYEILIGFSCINRVINLFANMSFITIAVYCILKFSSSTLADPPQITLNCLLKKQLKCLSSQGLEIIRAMEAVKAMVPQGSLILPVQTPFDCLIVRYYAFRPLAFCLKDAGITSYTNPSLFLRWIEIREKIEEIKNEQD